MGIRGDPKTKSVTGAPRVPVDSEYANIQKLVKKVIETTRCTQSEAEIALYDNNNDLNAAVEFILESENLESWTEAGKKEKKKNDEGKENRGAPRARGSGGFERGGRGRSNGPPKPREVVAGTAPSTNSRGGFDRPARGGRGAGGFGRGGANRQFHDQQRQNQQPGSAVKPTTEKQAPLVEQKPEPVTANVPTPADPNKPLSFAAIAAAAQRREEQKKHQGSQNVQKRALSPQPVAEQEQQPPTPREPTPEPETSYAEQSFNQTESATDAPSASLEDSDVLNGSNVSTNAAAWTSQLKSELGIGIGEPSVSQAPPSPIQNVLNTSIQSHSDPVLEFVDAAPIGAADYSFGFVDVPPSPIAQPQPVAPPTSSLAETSVASISTGTNENAIFNSSRVSNVTQKSVEVPASALTNGDFNLKPSSPDALNNGNGGLGLSTSRTLSYEPTSSVTYNPPTERLINMQQQAQQQFKAAPQQPQQVTAQAQQAQQPQQHQSAPQPPAPQQPPQPTQQQQQQQLQQQLMFPQQFPYNAYPYMNMYSPVRDDQYAALMQYNTMGIDLSTILPQQTPLSQGGPTPLSNSQLRDNHTLMDLNKFTAQNSRDQQPSNVGPPPGFQNPSYMPQNHLSSLFMQQTYPTHPFGFMNMMPAVSNAGNARMYGQDDERKSYEKTKQAQQQQQQQQQQAGQNNYHNGSSMYKNNGMNKFGNWP